MCGIFGIVSTGKIYRRDVDMVTRLMNHRGPDDFGLFIQRNNRVNVGLGHQRLSIIDLSDAGHQPMCNEDETIWIVYNGEIFNFIELREFLISKGHIFKSDTDTEVIIHAYEEWGIDCLLKFNGMFAFGIWDKKSQQLFIARDRLGIKPLYYTNTNNGILFSSEIKSLVNYPGIQREIDMDGFLSSLMLLWCPHPLTAFRNIRKLSPGHYIIYKNNRNTERQYWDLTIHENRYSIFDDSNNVLELLQQSIEKELISDVPLGAFLSGGLDSSAIIALMNKCKKEPVDTFTIAYSSEDRRYEAMPDDSKYSKIAARLFDTNHKEFIIEPDIVDLFPKLIWHLDEPVADPAAINTYIICKSAKEKGTTVLLSGIGADEIFGGYRKYLSARVAQYYRLLSWEIRQKIILRALSNLPVALKSRGVRISRWAKWFSRRAMNNRFECYLSNTSYYNKDDFVNLLDPNIRFDYETLYPIKRFRTMYDKVKNVHYINQMSYIDSVFYLADLNLTYTDKASMAASIEIRPPMLDHRMVEMAFRIHPREKIDNFRQKVILKEAMKSYLPSEIINRPKAPFGAPLRSWIARDLDPLISDLLSEKQINKRGLLNYQAVKRMIDDNKSGKEDNAHRIWSLLTVELWLRTFFDNDGSKPISL